MVYENDVMKFLLDKAHKFEDKFTTKAGRVLAFWGALTGLIALIPSIFGALYAIYVFGVHLYNLDTYVTQFKAMEKYQNFQIMQLTHMVEAEGDPKKSFGIDVRMTNAPEKHAIGDLWYFTYVKVNGEWHPITYGAFPNKTKQQVGILDMEGKYGVAGKEPHPDKEELRNLIR